MMRIGSRDVVVVGAGVSGLCCAIRLLERGFGVTLVAPALPSDADYADAHGAAPPPSSPWAAAVWYPYHIAEDARSARWFGATRAALAEIEADPESGVSTVNLVEGLAEGLRPPDAVAALPGFAWLPADEVPAGCATAYRVPVPLMDTPVYLRWLERRFRGLGGAFERRVLASLDEACAAGTVVVNCTGLGSRALAADPAVRPSRGQVVRVRRPAGAALPTLVTVAADGTPTYVFPRGADVVLGGTDGLDDWRTGADPEAAEEILARCRALVPALEGAEEVGRGSGLRPVRDGGQVRLEAERRAGGCTVVHDYGHGGSGFTVSWGCADEVVSLVAEAPDR